jgi:hypothetical protein
MHPTIIHLPLLTFFTYSAAELQILGHYTQRHMPEINHEKIEYRRRGKGRRQTINEMPPSSMIS